MFTRERQARCQARLNWQQQCKRAAGSVPSSVELAAVKNMQAAAGKRGESSVVSSSRRLLLSSSVFLLPPPPIPIPFLRPIEAARLYSVARRPAAAQMITHRRRSAAL